MSSMKAIGCWWECWPWSAFSTSGSKNPKSLLFVAGIVVVILSRYTHQTGAHPIINEIRTDPWALAGLFALACVWAPIVEESLFRGAFFHHMRRRHGWLLSALPVALIFAAIHPQGWLGIPVLASIALTLAGIREWRDSLIASITAHALNNGVVLAMVVLSIA